MKIPVTAEFWIPGLNALPEEIKEELTLQGLRLGSTLILLIFSWIIGQRIIAYWEIKKRIRESDLESENTFQRIHGEFKALWRIYKVYIKQAPDRSRITTENSPQWSLIERSSILEGEWEALLLKLAGSRKLTATDLTDLGLLRQLIQQLREGIKRNYTLDEPFREKDYQLFHTLSARVIEILRRPFHSQSAAATEMQMRNILEVKPADLEPYRNSAGSE